MIEPIFSQAQTPCTVVYSRDGGLWMLALDEFDKASVVLERGDKVLRSVSVDGEDVVILMDEVSGITQITDETIDRANKRAVADAARKSAFVPGGGL